jgi:hypothetical protein
MSSGRVPFDPLTTGRRLHFPRLTNRDLRAEAAKPRVFVPAHMRIGDIYRLARGQPSHAQAGACLENSFGLESD